MKKNIEMKSRLLDILKEMIGEHSFIFEGYVYEGKDNNMIYGQDFIQIRKATDIEIAIYKFINA